MTIDIQHFKSLLEAEKSRISSELEETAKKTGPTEESVEAIQPETDEDTADREDVAEAIESYENNESVVVALRTQLNEVEKALEKIESGKYGICEISGKEIELDRLEANPSARTCKEYAGEL